jgi:hypothetical protein
VVLKILAALVMLKALKLMLMSQVLNEFEDKQKLYSTPAQQFLCGQNS